MQKTRAHTEAPRERGLPEAALRLIRGPAVWRIREGSVSLLAPKEKRHGDRT